MTGPVDPRSFLPLTPLAFQVLLALAEGDRHGYGIIREVEDRTDGLIKLRTGTLYTLLQRLLEEALIDHTPEPEDPVQAPPIKNEVARERSGAPGSPQASALGGVQPPSPRLRRPAEAQGAEAGGAPPIKNDSRRRYYRLTEFGRDVLTAEARRLESLIADARRAHVLDRTTKA